MGNNSNNRNLPWHDVAHGRMSKDAQQKFEKAQRLAIDTGLAVKMTVEITVKPQRKGERSLLPVQYQVVLKEPPMRSKEYEMVLDPIGTVAIKDSEVESPQESLMSGNGGEA